MQQYSLSHMLFVKKISETMNAVACISHRRIPVLSGNSSKYIPVISEQDWKRIYEQCNLLLKVEDEYA